jgi:four helix bundle protein
MLKPYTDPYGYKKLLAYKKAEELQMACSHLTRLFPFSKTLSSLADQMDRSARSGKQNIVEGWKRNTTKEYYDFLGFSIGAVAELEEDCDDIIRGAYPELVGIRGVMGEKGDNSTPSNPRS